MQALHTQFLSPKEDLATLENYLEKARRERKNQKQVRRPGALISLRTGSFQSAFRSKLSRFVLLGSDNERNQKREVCLSLLFRRIG